MQQYQDSNAADAHNLWNFLHGLKEIQPVLNNNEK